VSGTATGIEQLEPVAVTLVAWVRGADTPPLFRNIASKGAVGCTAASYSLYTGGVEVAGPHFYFWDGAAVHRSPPIADASLWDGAWHMLAGTYATREVCTSNHPPVVRTEGNVFCYRGDGAGLNDINGTERDNTGHYIPGEQYCHDIVSDGYVVPAAKRPATKTLPAPGVVNTKTHIAWRPVAPDVDIAN